MTIETVYLSQKEKDLLLKLKRATGIQNWNILCRWAFCLSLKNKSAPQDTAPVSEHAIEMTWKVFGGQDHEIYLALLKERFRQDNFDENKDSLTKYLRCHLHRGIVAMAEKLRNKRIEELYSL